MYSIENSIIRMIDSISLPDNPVIIYDIDNTLIDSYGIPIFHILRTYHYAKKKGIGIVIITAREGNPTNIINTRLQLSKIGVKDDLLMYFRPENNIGDAKAQYEFKLKCRKDVYEKGYNTIASIGDMPWDIGIYGGYGFIVPS